MTENEIIELERQVNDLQRKIVDRVFGTGQVMTFGDAIDGNEWDDDEPILERSYGSKVGNKGYIVSDVTVENGVMTEITHHFQFSWEIQREFSFPSI